MVARRHVALPGAHHGRVDVDVVEDRAATVAFAQVVHAAEVEPQRGVDRQQLDPLERREGEVALDRREVGQRRVPVVGDEDVLGQHEVTEDECAVAAVPAVRTPRVVRDRGPEAGARPVVGAPLLARRLLADGLVDHRRDPDVRRPELRARHPDAGPLEPGEAVGPVVGVVDRGRVQHAHPGPHPAQPLVEPGPDLAGQRVLGEHPHQVGPLGRPVALRPAHPAALVDPERGRLGEEHRRRLVLEQAQPQRSGPQGPAGGVTGGAQRGERAGAEADPARRGPGEQPAHLVGEAGHRREVPDPGLLMPAGRPGRGPRPAGRPCAGGGSAPP